MASDDPIRLFLIDDHSLYRSGLRDAFAGEPGVVVVGESEIGAGTLDLVTDAGATVVLVDLRLPDVDGIEVCRSIVNNSKARCVVLTSFHASESDLVRAADAGASAYLVKGAPLGELIASIGAVAAGADLLSHPEAVHRYS